MSILYARQALATILANWSMSGPRISAELLKCEEHNLALVLDVLNRDSTNLKQFEKVRIVTYYTGIARLHNTLVCGFIEES